MDAREDAPPEVAGRRALRRPVASLPAAAMLALAVLPLAAGCGGDLATESASPGTRVATPAAEGGLDPPKSSGGSCERTAADGKSLPPLARLTVERFIAAADRGDHEAMRALFDPLGTEEALANLRPVTRLGLLALEDRY